MKKITLNPTTQKIIKIIVSVVLVAAVVVGSFISGFYTYENTHDTYMLDMTVTDVIDDEVYFVSDSGHLFSIITQEIFACGENYKITFSTNDTPTVEDDVIIGICREISV